MHTTTFQINIPETAVTELQQKLQAARFPASLNNNWSAGAPVAYLQRITEYWLHSFDWRRQEAWLNQFPQYMTEINGQPVHFVHIRSSREDAVPLLLLHGYPSSWIEFLEVAEILSEGGNAPFHLVIPSLPGFGFSAVADGAKWDMAQIAFLLAELMTGLGYERFGIHGTDMGAGICGMLSGMAAHRLIGTHVNTDYTSITAMGMLPRDTGAFTVAEQQRIEAFRQYEREGTAYLKMISTRPQTVAAALADSPVALLAWIIEKFKYWTNDSNPLPEDAISLDLILTQISMYWFTNTGATSAYTVYHSMNMTFDWGAPASDEQPSWQPPKVPSAMAAFGGDGPLLQKLLAPMGAPGRWSVFEEGLHFPAMECPETLAADISGFFRGL